MSDHKASVSESGQLIKESVDNVCLSLYESRQGMTWRI